MSKRMKVCLAAGALLGVVCILGAQIRSDFSKDFYYLFAFWYNRVILGLVMGLAGNIKDIRRGLIRGAFFGLVVSFAFYSSTGFSDHMGFIAGIIYGIIIEFAVFKVVKRKF